MGTRLSATFVISDLKQGGAQRAVVEVVRELAVRHVDVTLVVLAPAETDFFAVLPTVQVVRARSNPLGAGRMRSYFSWMLSLIRLRILLTSRRDSVVVAFEAFTGIAVALALSMSSGRRPQFWISERVDFRAHNAGRFVTYLRPWAYRRAAGLIAQTAEIGEALQVFRPKAVRVIPNIVRPHLSDSLHQSGREKVVLFAGRYHDQKGIDLLLRAWNGITPDGWRLVLAGRGDPAPYVLLAQELGLKCVDFLAEDPEIWQRMSRASIFVLPSRYEGFPNALCEAMALGCAVVTTNGPGAMSDIVLDGAAGVLVNVQDLEHLRSGLMSLMNDEVYRARLSVEAQLAIKRFFPESVAPLWVDLIAESAATSGNATT